LQELKGFQKKYLRGLAHALSPVVIIGQNGLTDTVVQAVDGALKKHELIKIKFNEFKEKQQKKEISRQIEIKTDCQQVGAIGHTAIFFRENTNPEEKKIELPIR
jgi:RNA-binding protein